MVSLRKGKALSSRVSHSPQLHLQQLLLRPQGNERGSCPLPARAGLLSCSSPSVAPDSSRFTVCHLSLVQQTLPFLRSKGFKTCFLELPFPKLGGTYRGEGSTRARLPALPSSLPWLWGPSRGACPTASPAGTPGDSAAPSTSAAFLGTVGTSPPMGHEEPAERCVGLHGAGLTESPSKVAFSEECIMRGVTSLLPLGAHAASGAVGARLGHTSKGKTFPRDEGPGTEGCCRGGGGTPQWLFLDKFVYSAPVPFCPLSVPACVLRAELCHRSAACHHLSAEGFPVP